MTPPIFDHCLRYIELGAQVILVLLLWRRGLAKRYGLFMFWLSGMALRSGSLIWIPYQSDLYSRLWAVTQPLLWGLQFLALLEVMHLVFEHYPRLGNAAKVITTSSFIAGVVFGLGTSFVDLGTARMPWWMDAAWSVTKAVSWVTFFVLLAQMAWFVIFPVPMIPNVVRHRILFTLYAGFLPGIGYMVAGTGTKAMNRLTNEVYMTGNIIILALWCLLLKNSTEYTPLLPPPSQPGKSPNGTPVRLSQTCIEGDDLLNVCV